MGNFTSSIRDICQFFAENPDSDIINFIDGEWGHASGLDFPEFGNAIWKPRKIEITQKSVDECINAAYDKIFDFDYPIFDYTPATVDPSIPFWCLPIGGEQKTNYQRYLEKKILKHYYMREIGFETLGQFQLHLNAKLNDIMPYYNQLYITIQNEIINEVNPYHDVNYSTIRNIGVRIINDNNTITKNRTLSKTNTENNTAQNDTSYDGSSNKTNYDVNKYSDTPQGSGGVGIGNLNNGYLTSANIADKSENMSATFTQGNTSSSMKNRSAFDEDTSNDTVTKMRTEGGRIDDITVTGKRGVKTYAQMLMEYRKTFLNIDMEIINNLEPLFFGLWE